MLKCYTHTSYFMIPSLRLHSSFQYSSGPTVGDDVLGRVAGLPPQVVNNWSPSVGGYLVAQLEG